MYDPTPEPGLAEQSQAALDRLLGPGAGKRHTAFLDELPHPELAAALHRAHLWAVRDEHLSPQEHYLIGMTVLYAQRAYGPAGMFARTLLHLKTDSATVVEAVARLALWIGPVQAAEAAGHLMKAVTDYQDHGLASLEAWLPGISDAPAGATS
jgi:hypothetical protein